MSSFFAIVLSATVALSTAQPTGCDPTAVLGLSSALGVTLAGIAAAAVYAFKDRLCCTRGDSQRVYDTPCPYCEKKQPRDCVREHLADCEEHRKFWSPRLTRQEQIALRVNRPSRISVNLPAPQKPSSLPASNDVPGGGNIESPQNKSNM